MYGKYNDDIEIQQKHQYLKEKIYPFLKNVPTFIENMTDEEIEELEKYLRRYINNYHSSPDTSIEKTKMLILLFQNLYSGHEIGKILSYLESAEYGWHGDKYNLNNDCLRYFLFHPKGCCKRISNISYVEMAEEIFGDIYEIFFHEEYGDLTLFIFSYCLTALFSSKLDQDNFPIPFFLQIACHRNSILYELIQEIVEICDVNSGVFDYCNAHEFLRSYRYCGYVPKVFYPTQSTAKDIDDIVSNNKDVSVVIDGHENERHYTSLLREIANIPNKKKPLDTLDRFSILPVFICPAIKSSFNNIFDIDLTELDINKEYLTLIRKRKQMLASWVLDLVVKFNEYLFPNMKEHENHQKHPFSSNIGSYINYIRSQYPELTLDNAKNIGFLNYFFKGCMKVFQGTFKFPIDSKFAIVEKNGEPLLQDGEKNINLLTDQSEKSLVTFHRRYLPAPNSMGINNKEAIRLAKQIEKNYRDLKAFIRVMPHAVKKDRYIFSVDTLRETKDTDVGRNAETVQRRLKKYEYFRVDLRDKTTIRLIVAEKPLEDNSLIEILKQKDFKDSKMRIPYAVGFDETGAMCIEDICDFPHLLLGGATFSGKSTALKSLLLSIAYKHRTGNVNVMILDLLSEAESDFEVFNNQPFLICPVIKDPRVGLNAIIELDKEMANRANTKNLSDMPYIVCVIDEFPRLFTDIDDKPTINSLVVALNHLSSRGRHTKIHLVLAAQNPIKKHMIFDTGNFHARMAFKCAHYHNSVAILSKTGAEKLLGKGQMIFDSYTGDNKRLQGSYIMKDDIEKLLSEIKRTFKQENKYPFIIGQEKLTHTSAGSVEIVPMIITNTKSSPEDEKLPEVILWSLAQDKIANSRIQNQFNIGNNRAKKILNRMAELDIINRLHGNLGWEVKPKRIEDVSYEAIEILTNNDFSKNDIKKCFELETEENVFNHEVKN